MLQKEGIKPEWLLFCPVLPATPSSPRVTVWRRMRAAGAAGLDNGLWLLPNTEAAAKFIQEMQQYVSDQGGSSKTFVSDAFDEATLAEIINRFQQDRAEEYFELREQCSDFLAELDNETKRENFSFAEYEENDEDLRKLDSWFLKIQRRDFLDCEQAHETDNLLQQCRDAFALFASKVFSREVNRSGDSEPR